MNKSSALYKNNAADLKSNPDLYQTNEMHLPTVNTKIHMQRFKQNQCKQIKMEIVWM